MSIPTLPGISAEAIQAAGIRHVTAGEADTLCGHAHAGLWIPYRKLSGEPVRRDCDTPQGYGRLRPTHTAPGGPRYLQRKGSKAYGYLVPSLIAPRINQPDLVVVEGEKKALSLLDAGILAVGVGGLTLAMQDGQLVPGLRELVNESATLRRILFLGDGDTSLLFAFSREAVKLARLPHGLAVACPRIGLDGPGKGIDDVRATIGAEAFGPYWQNLVAHAEPVRPEDSAEMLAVRLLKREPAQKLKEVANGQLS